MPRLERCRKFCISNFCHQEKVPLSSYLLIIDLKRSEPTCLSPVIVSVSEFLIIQVIATISFINLWDAIISRVTIFVELVCDTCAILEDQEMLAMLNVCKLLS